MQRRTKHSCMLWIVHVWAHHGGGLARVVACACKWASGAKLQCVGSSSACTVRPARGAAQEFDSVTVGCCCRECSTQLQSVSPCAVAARGHTACIAWWWTCGYLRALFSRRGFAALSQQHVSQRGSAVRIRAAANVSVSAQCQQPQNIGGVHAVGKGLQLNSSCSVSVVNAQSAWQAQRTATNWVV